VWDVATIVVPRPFPAAIPFFAQTTVASDNIISTNSTINRNVSKSSSSDKIMNNSYYGIMNSKNWEKNQISPRRVSLYESMNN
jgi:hypothetical protein